MGYKTAVCGRCGCKYKLEQSKKPGGGRGDDPTCPCDGGTLYTEKQGYSSVTIERIKPNPNCKHGKEMGYAPL